MDKSIFNFKILYQNGELIDLHDDLNLWVSYFRISSLSPGHTAEQIDGRHGSVYLGTTLSERTIRSGISIESISPKEFDALRDEIFKLFNPTEKIFIIRDLQPGKRVEVSVAKSFDVEYLSLEDGEFEVEFINHSVYQESVGTTLQPFTYDMDYAYQIEQPLKIDEIPYVHETATFKIYNDGDIVVDPREHYLVIEYKGASNNLVIENITTGDKWQHNGSTNGTDVVTLEKIRSLKNGISIFGDTNRKLITLSPGWNDIKLSGTVGAFSISFDFRTYYI